MYLEGHYLASDQISPSNLVDLIIPIEIFLHKFVRKEASHCMKSKLPKHRELILQKHGAAQSSPETSLADGSSVEQLIAGAKAMLSSANAWSLEEEQIEDDSIQWLAENDRLIDEILASSSAGPQPAQHWA